MAAAAHRPMTYYQADPMPRLGARIGGTIRLWRSRIADRRALASFDYRDLRDVGVTRWDVDRELAKPFWRG